MKDPLNTFSRRVPQAVESTPAYEAMFTDSRVIPNTWGNLASQLVELGVVEPSLEAACSFLDIASEDIKDPRLIFTESYSVDVFHSRSIDRWRKEYQEDHKDDDASFLSYLETSLLPFMLNDEQKAEADVIQAEIEGLSEREYEQRTRANETIRKIPESEGNRLKAASHLYEVAEALSTSASRLCLMRDALSSGIMVPMDQFMELILGYEEQGGPSLERTMAAANEVLYRIVQDYLFSAQTDDVRVDEVMLGEAQIREFRDSLASQIRSLAYIHAAAKWEAIEHLFYAGDYREHPLFTGIHDN